MKEEFLTIQEAAEFFGVTTRTLRRWEEKGYLTSHRLVGNQRRYSKAQLKSLLTAPQVSSAEKVMETGSAQQNESYNPIAASLNSSLVNGDANNSPAKTTPVNHLQPTIPLQPEHTNRSKQPQWAIGLAGVAAGLVVLFLSAVVISNAQGLNNGRTSLNAWLTPDSKETANTKGVLADTDVTSRHVMQVNIPAIFGKKVTFLDSVEIKKQLRVDGLSNLFGGIRTNNKDVDAGTGSLTASNVVYSLVAGANISISGDPQNPTISSTGGVTSLQGQTGAVVFTGGQGVALNGLEISNTGVLSVQGQTGAVAFSPGAGIAINGLTITNSDPGSAQRIFSTFDIEGTEITADSNDDTFTFAAGSGITLAANTSDKSLTISTTGGGGGSQWTTTGSDIYYNTGNVGIGNTAPGRTLDVTGTGRFSGALTLSSLGAGVVKSDGSGLLSSSAINLASGDVTGTLSPANGGTGVGGTPTNGQILIGNGSGFTLGTITAGSGIGVANGSGTITITNNGVTSLTGTANQITTSGSTGAITLSLPQDIATTSTPIFASMTLTANTNQLTLGTGNTGVLTLGVLTSGRTYTLPDASGEVCLSTGNCPGGGGGNINGTGTTNYIPKFTGAASIGNSIIYDSGSKIGIGTTSPEGLFSVVGGAAGQPLVSLNETGDQNILVGSASGTTRFVFDRTGNLNIIGGGYQIGGTSVLSSTTLGSGVINSSLTTVGALNAGSITSGFGAIDIGPDNLSAGGTITFAGLGTGIVKSTGGVLSSGSVNLGSGEVTGTLGVGNGGTGTAATPTNGQLLIGNGTGYTLAGLTAGTAIQVVNGAGTITINNTGVTSLAGTANQVNVSGPTGAVTLSLPQDIHAGATPSFASLNLTNNTNPLILGTTNTGTLTLGGLTTGRTYTLPDASGDFCLTSGNCAGVGGTGDITTVGDVLSGDAFSAAGTQGRSLYFYDVDGRGQLTTANLTQARTYTLPDSDGTVCLFEAGNCSGGAGSSKWQLNGTVIAPLTATNEVVLGGNTTTPFQFEVNGSQIGKALVSFNETGNQDIFTASASGTTRFTIGNNGNLAATGTLTGLTGLTSSGTIQFSGLTTGIVKSNASGVLSSSAVNLASADVTGTLPVGNGGTGTGTFTQGGVLYGNGTSPVAASAQGTAGQALVSGGTGSPTWTTGTLTLAGNFATSGTSALTLTTTGVTNVTLPTTGTLATLAGTETFSNKTLTAPRFVNGGFIADANGNELVIFNTTASAINELTLTNAAASGVVTLAATGGDTNIPLALDSKGTGNLLLNGTSTGNVLLAGGFGATGCTVINASGNFSCDGSIAATGTITGSNISGSNTGDQTITLSGDVGGTGTGAISTTIQDNSVDGTDIQLGSDAAGDLMYYNGTDWVRLAAGSTTQVLHSGTTPSWSALSLTTDVTGTLPVGNGGTGAVTLTQGGVLYGNGTSPVGASAQGTAGQALLSGGAGSPTWTTGTLALAGNFSTSGASALTLTTTGATNVTLPTTGTLATLAGTETLSNKTLTAPRFVNGGFIADANGNEQLIFNTTASAINEITIANAAAGGAVTLAATGGDTNIPLAIDSKGTGDLRLNGTSTGNVLLAGGFGATGCTVTNSNGNFDCNGSISATGTVTGSNISGTNTGDQTITLSGDVGGTGTGAISTTIQDNSVDGTDIQLGSDAAGDLMYYNGTDWVRLAAGSATQVLHSGTTPSWSALSLTTDVSGILPIANGGTNTNATPTSGGVAYGTGTAFAFSSAGAGGECLRSAGAAAPTWGSCAGGVNYWNQTAGALSPINSTVDLLVGGTATASAKFGVLNMNSGTPVASISANSGNNAAYLTGDGTFGTTNRGNLTIGNSTTYNTTGNVLINPNGQGNVGIGSTNPASLLDITSQTTNGLRIYSPDRAKYIQIAYDGSNVAINPNGTQTDIVLGPSHFTAGVTLGALTGNNGGVLYANGSGTVAKTLAGTSDQCLMGGTTPAWGTCALGTNYWNQTAGALSPINSTVDLLVGGTSSASAKFAVLNVNNGTPIASVSATATGNGVSLAGDGVIQSLRNNTLTLGGSTTGDIVLEENLYLGSASTGLNVTTAGAISDVNGNLALNDNTDITGNLDVSGTLTTGTGNAFQVDATGNISTSGTTGLTLSSTGGIILNGGVISDGTDGVDINDDLEIAGNTAFGDAITDTLTFTGRVVQEGDLIPITATGTNDLGTALLPWDNIFGINVSATTFTQNGATLASTYAPINANFVTVTANATLTGETGIDALTTAISTTSTLNADGASTLGASTLDATGTLTLAGSATLNGGSAANDDLILQGTSNATRTSSYVLLQPTAGNVGIGVSTPTEKLHMDGKLRFASAFENTTDGNVKIFTGAVPETTADGTLSAAQVTAITNYGTNGNGLVFQYGGTDDAGGMKLSDSGLVLWGSGDEDLLRVMNEDDDETAFVIDNDGDVLVSGGNLELGLSASGLAEPSWMEVTNYATGSTGGGQYMGNWANTGCWALGTNTNSSSDNTVRMGITGCNNDWNATQNIRMIMNGTIGATALAAFDVRAASGTLAVATVSGTTAHASLVVDQNGTGDILTASKSGLTKFTVKNSGKTIIGRDFNSGNLNELLTLKNVAGSSTDFTMEDGNGTNRWTWFATTGGATGFYDASNALSPFTIEEGSPGNSIYIRSAGVGFGTNVPSQAIELGSGEIIQMNAGQIQDYAGLTLKVDADNSAANDDFQVLNGTSGIMMTLTETAQLGVGTNVFTNMPAGSIHVDNGAVCVDNGSSICDNASRNAGTIYAVGGNVVDIDLAELFPSKDGTLEAGEIVVADPDNAEYIKRSTGKYQRSILGVVSTKPGILLGGWGEHAEAYGNDKKYPLALAGRIPTKVSTENGPIKPGDYLTSSSIPGVAMKATQAGPTVAKALEAYNNPNPSSVGKVIALVNPSWYDPHVSFNADGNVSYDGNALSNGQLPQMQGPTAPTVAQTNSNDAFDPLTFNDRVATTSALTEVKAQTNALSDMLNALTGRVDTLETMASGSAFTQPGSMDPASAEELDLDKLDAKDVTVSNTLAVAGRTTLADVGITGKMNIGLLSIDGLDDDGSAAINSSVGELKLQSNGLNGIDILDGKMTIDNKGNVETEGEITAKKVNIDTEDVAGASLGEAVLESGETKVVVTTNALTDKSKIFVQPLDIPITTAVKKIADDKFEIRIRSAEATDVKLSWWIVN